jgi:hypothetical protein
MRGLRAVASSVPGEATFQRAEQGEPSTGASVPYFELYVKGHLTDSVRAHLTGSAVDDGDRREHDVLLGTKPVVPYFELSLTGSMRISHVPIGVRTPA